MNILVPDISIAEKVLRALQNAMIGEDNSLAGGVIGAVTIPVLNAIVAYLTFRFNRIDRIVEHSPPLPVRHGVVSLRDIRYAFLEEDGHASVVTRRPAGE